MIRRVIASSAAALMLAASASPAHATDTRRFCQALGCTTSYPAPSAVPAPAQTPAAVPAPAQTPTPVPPPMSTPTPETPKSKDGRCFEDEPCWVWSTMGNRKRGVILKDGRHLVVGTRRFSRLARGHRINWCATPRLKGDWTARKLYR